MSNETPEPDVSPVEVSVPAESIWEEAPSQPVMALPPTSGPSGNSIAALVLSIASWAIFPIVLAIVALVFANKAEKEITTSNGSISGGVFCHRIENSRLGQYWLLCGLGDFGNSGPISPHDPWGFGELDLLGGPR